MKSLSIRLFIVLLTLILVSAAGAKSPRIVTLMTHDSFSVSNSVLSLFEAEHGVKVRILKAGDAGAALNQAILTKNNPLADVFFGVDNSFMTRALKADLFEPYRSPRLADIQEQFIIDPQFRLLPVDFGDVCLNYDKVWFEKRSLSPPKTLECLIKPEYKGLTVVQNPASSSPGLSFLLATVGSFGDPQYLDFWKALNNNRVLVVEGWKQAYWGHFTAASKGDRPIVVSYSGSPAAEVHFSEKKLESSPTAAVLTQGSAFRQIEFVGILRGAKNQADARKLVDFMLDIPFQQDIPLQMFVFPTHKHAKLPAVFKRHAQIAEQPVQVNPDDIDRYRETWIQAWTETVLR